MTQKHFGCLLFLLVIWNVLAASARSQTLADIARKERERKQQQMKAGSTPKLYTNENIPHGKWKDSMPSPSASPSASPIPLPSRSSASWHDGAYSPFLILGYALMAVGQLWMLVVTFRTSIWWGLGCLFIPLVELFYWFSYWKEARWPFWLQFVGLAIVLALHNGF